MVLVCGSKAPSCQVPAKERRERHIQHPPHHPPGPVLMLSFSGGPQCVSVTGISLALLPATFWTPGCSSRGFSRSEGSAQPGTPCLDGSGLWFLWVLLGATGPWAVRAANKPSLPFPPRSLPFPSPPRARGQGRASLPAPSAKQTNYQPRTSHNKWLTFTHHLTNPQKPRPPPHLPDVRQTTPFESSKPHGKGGLAQASLARRSCTSPAPPLVNTEQL